jgi:hypothetical protein
MTKSSASVWSRLSRSSPPPLDRYILLSPMFRAQILFSLNMSRAKVVPILEQSLRLSFKISALASFMYFSQRSGSLRAGLRRQRFCVPVEDPCRLVGRKLPIAFAAKPVEYGQDAAGGSAGKYCALVQAVVRQEGSSR